MTPAAALLGDALPSEIVALAQRARNGRVVVYAGAGLSRAEPTALPSGAELSLHVFSRLVGLFPSIATCDPYDLLAVADAVALLPGGEAVLQETAARAAEFTNATPNHGHRCLALLLLEGVVDVLTTNWDNCIERGVTNERVSAIVDSNDLLYLAPKSLLKIHGCATLPVSLLLTTAQLSNPPTWVTDETRARLGNSIVVFIGIGDVAGYVRVRIQEAVADVDQVENVRVVAPDIVEHWETNQWSSVLPSLAIDHRIGRTSDEFLDRFLASYVKLTLDEVADRLEAEPHLQTHITSLIELMGPISGFSLLRWVRAACVSPAAGKAVLATQNTVVGLAALSKLAAGTHIELRPDQTIVVGDETFELVVSTELETASRLRREAQNRLAAHRDNGLEAARLPTYLVAGGLGWTSSQEPPAEQLLQLGDVEDILDGPLNGGPRIKRAEDVLAA
jgi:hypothetical protein